jgi:hypothetical protein
LLTAPSAVAQNEAQAGAATELATLRQHQQSRERALRRIDEMQADELERYPGEAGQVARATGGGRSLASFLDQERDRPGQERLRAAQAGRAEAQTGLAQAQTERARRLPGGSANMLTPAAIVSRLNAIDRTLRDDFLLEEEDKAELTEEAELLRDELLRRTEGGAPSPQPAKGSGKQMNALPDPKANKGRTIRDTETGERYQSDGKRWLKIGGAPATAGEY